MRVVWALLILLSVFAPVGQLGVTQTPSDAVQLTAPGARSAPVQRKLDLGLDVQLEVVIPRIAIDIAPLLPSSLVAYVHIPAVLPARPVVASESPRGPPV